MRNGRRLRGIGLGAIALALGGLGLGADAPPRTIDAGGLTFQVPSAWKSSKPSSTMRRAQLTVEPAEGDTDPAELVVFAFPGGAGTVDANVKRWQSQFRDKDGNPPKVDSKTVQGKNAEVTRVEIAGHYIAPKFPGSVEVNDKPHWRLLGAIVQTNDTGYYLKMIGPEKTMNAAKAEFDGMLKSVNVEK